MKVLVYEISYTQLLKIKTEFVSDEEIRFIEFCDKSLELYDLSECNLPYYIEENIKDIDRLLDVCQNTSYKNNEFWCTFSKFWRLILEIKKQREIGYKIKDLDYVYLKVKDLTNIELTTSDKIDGFTFTTPVKVLIGKSKLGNMMLYKDSELNCDFVFSVCYYKQKRLSKKIEMHYTHWHPKSYKEAIKDIMLFMGNDLKLRNEIGI